MRQRLKGAPPPLPVVLPEDPRVRQQRVSQHSLTDYDTLLQGQQEPTP
jgi:hypothetical protein